MRECIQIVTWLFMFLVMFTTAMAGVAVALGFQDFAADMTMSIVVFLLCAVVGVIVDALLYGEE